MLRGEGGGPRVKKIFSSILIYVVALLMGFLKWVHFSLNSQRLSRYESPKMGRFHAFSTFSIGKEPNFGPKFKLVLATVALQMLHLTPNLVSIILQLKSRFACKGFLIFRFFGILWPFLVEIFAVF